MIYETATEAKMTGVKLSGVTKSFGETIVMCKVPMMDLQFDEGEFVVIVGPSGCGKSTTLRMIAGLEPVSSGQRFSKFSLAARM